MDQLYTEEEKHVFAYRTDPEQVTEVWGDPVAIQRRLSIALDGDPNGVMRAARPGPRPKDADGNDVPETPEEVVARLTAEERLHAAVREAFELPPWDRVTKTGTTDAVCAAALNCFLSWLSKNVRAAGS